MTLRWTFYDPIADETYVVSRNPNAMNDIPLVSRTFRHGTAWGADGRIPSFETAPTGLTLNFAGRVADEAHYNALLDWSQRPNEVQITDHLGRSFIVFITAFRPEELTPTPRNNWRVNYAVEAQILVLGGSLVGRATEGDTARPLS
ncbi:hypothetical protein GCM10028801_30620 [Nocardioides maradonensis]